MLFDSHSDQIIEAMRAKRRDGLKAYIRSVREHAQMPAEIRDRGLERKHYYEGRGLPYFRAFLKKIYPKGMEANEIHPTMINYPRVFAASMSDVYAPIPPVRRMEDQSLQAGLDSLVREARLLRWMPEIEQRVNIGMCHFVRLVPSPLTGKMQVRPFWPHDVWVVENPADRSSLQHSLALAARTGLEEYEVWTREGDGWRAEIVDLSDEDAPQVRPLLADGEAWPSKVLPWAVYQSGMGEGAYTQRWCDLIDNANDMNLFWTEVVSLMRYQAHTPLVYQGSSPEGLSGGPGAFAQISPGETLTALHLSPQINAVLESSKQFSRAQAIAARQPPAAFSTDPSHASSGIARRVENQVAEDARRARVLDVKDFEESSLMPVLFEMDRVFGKKRVPVDAVYSFEAQDLPDFEEPTVRQMALERVYELGGMTLEAFLVKLGFAPNEEVARGQIDQKNRERHLYSPNRDRRQEADVADRRASDSANQTANLEGTGG